ncbi:phosphoribosyltransferase [Microbacterium sp. NPDC057407]|uniref:phosphoribosyltransferase n=1 Tax=Microbacterium sp. NPDC057407 TaxID=3346120 RepID=UPI00366DAD23
MAIFADRVEAGKDLARSLDAWRGTNAVVVGIPRGGVVVAAAVASELGLELTAAVVRKLGSPVHEEYALGAIADGVRVVDDDAARRERVSPAQLAGVEQAERRELRRRSEAFGGSTVEVAGRDVIVVDDGIATGATATAACRWLRLRHPSRIVLAVPVAPAAWRPQPEDADAYICPHPQRDFWAVGAFYTDFAQTTDAEVVELLSPDLRAE